MFHSKGKGRLDEYQLVDPLALHPSLFTSVVRISETSPAYLAHRKYVEIYWVKAGHQACNQLTVGLNSSWQRDHGAHWLLARLAIGWPGRWEDFAESAYVPFPHLPQWSLGSKKQGRREQRDRQIRHGRPKILPVSPSRRGQHYQLCLEPVSFLGED